MSQAAHEILAELQRRGVTVVVEGDDGLCLKPRRALDETLLARIREAKPAILEALRARPATCSPACYEVEPGIWIHRPHTGCTHDREARQAKPYTKKQSRSSGRPR